MKNGVEAEFSDAFEVHTDYLNTLESRSLGKFKLNVDIKDSSCINMINIRVHNQEHSDGFEPEQVTRLILIFIFLINDQRKTKSTSILGADIHS